MNQNYIFSTCIPYLPFLFSQGVVFIKIHNLPKSRWAGTKDKVVNVPITSDDLLKTFDEIQSFPKQPLDAGLIPVKLKRKKSYKNAVLKAWIDPELCVKAVNHFRLMGHPGYQDINIEQNYFPQVNMDNDSSIDRSDNEEMNNETGEQREESAQTAQQGEESDDDDRLAAVAAHQHDLGENFLMANDHPEALCVSGNSKKAKELNLAPGEGKIPGNVLRDLTWDVNAFPHLFPSGQFGLNHERPIKITSKQFVLQRIQNIDPQFRNSKSFLFAWLYYIERKQFEQRINVSCQRGKMSDGIFEEWKDPMSVFDEVRGTPKYWQKKRMEMVAKIQQLGPFQFFFTLSCADKRWEENFISIFSQMGHKVVIEKKGNIENDLDDEYEVFIDDMPLNEFLEDQSLHQIVKDNVLTITKVFDKRVHNFIKHIVQPGKKTAMNTKHFQYRIEFQARGAGHVHGVLWLDLPGLEEQFPGIKNIFQNIKLNKNFNEEETSVLEKFIDTFISCSLNTEQVSKIAKEVQIHHHTKTCRKYGSKCRFNFPRFPSIKTIIAQPLSMDDFSTEKEFEAELCNLEKVLENVKYVLDNMDDLFGKDKLFTDHLLDEITLGDILEHAKVKEDLYYKALSVSRAGKVIVLKRNVDEIWVNNYNPEWLLAWNGNMDIQLCLDYFAIVTYITDYYTKDETGTLEHLLKAAKECHGKSQKEKMKALSQVWSTHRKIGESEAYYRLFPELHLVDSDIKTTFVATGFPNNRSRFLRRLCEENDEGDDHDDNDDLENIEISDTKIVQIPGSDQKYINPPTVHERYAARPDSLEHICLAQFAIWYVPVPKRAKLPKDMNAESLEMIICPHLETPTFMPTFIQLKKPELGNMRLRAFPAVLRMHKFKEAQNAHEFFFSELCLYFHWRDENEIHPNDFDACLSLFLIKSPNGHGSIIEDIKNKLFPEMNNVEMARALIEDFPITRPSHIGEALDPQNEQDNEDQNFEGEQVNNDQQVRAYDGNFGGNDSEEPSMFKRSDFSNLETMLELAKNLAPEQQLVFNLFIGYAKELRKYIEGSTLKPKPPLAIVHGGAGSGKSTLIRAISFWTDKVLTTNDNKDLNKPFVIRCAPTGMAAHNIDGLTICSAFRFKFGRNDHVSYSDTERDKFQEILSHIKLVIIDEMSMVKSDELYKLNVKLQEITNNKDEDFGGVALLLLGDLMQLQPVKGKWIFEKPAHSMWTNRFTIDPLWELCNVYILEKNHRQGKDKEYGDILNRLRFGEHTEEDVLKIKSRISPNFPQGIPEDALVLYGKKKNVMDYNMHKLNQIEGETFTVSARHVHPTLHNFKPKISDEGGVSDTQFLDQLIFKIGARVMLIHNVATTDGLTNGACGEILGIECENDNITNIIVKFDNADVGQEHRKQYPQIQAKFSNNLATSITRVSVEYSVGDMKKAHSAKAKVIQFPLKLAWAITSHKIQGQTIKDPKPVGMDIQTTFSKAQAYVMLGRVENLQQVYLADFKDNKLGCSIKSLLESENLQRRADELLAGNSWLNCTSSLKISCLNIRSLKNHYSHLCSDSYMLKSDIIAITETWLPKKGFVLPEREELQSYNVLHVMAGKGKGVSLFYKKHLHLIDEPEKISMDPFQIIKVRLENLTIIVVYRSPQIESHTLLLESLIHLVPQTCPAVICGDFNTDPKKALEPYHKLTSTLATQGFNQIVDTATHLKGGILDHFYVRNTKIIDWHLHHPYYTDHDAICMQLSFEDLWPHYNYS